MTHPTIKLTSADQFTAVQQGVSLLVNDGFSEARANDVMYEYYRLHHGDLGKVLSSIQYLIALRRQAKKHSRGGS